MVPMIDFIESERIKGRAYQGNAGMKRAYLHDGIVWMVKFPKSTRELTGKHLPPYTSSPLSEYIGSHIYSSLGIPTHETVLGRCNEKIVVGCKDFTVDADLLDFHGIKNTVDDELISGSLGSSARGERLKDVMSVIENAADFKDIRDEVKARFWDMFVVDALIHNNDRNNGNWGLLASRYTVTLAPIFDNGNSFFNKKNPSVTERQVADIKSIENDALNILSFFLDDNDDHIKPLKYIENMGNPDCTAALVRLSERVNMRRIRDIVEEIPEEAFGLKVISPETKKLYIGVIEAVVKNCFNPTLAKLGHRTIDIQQGCKQSQEKAVSPASETKDCKAASQMLNETDSPIKRIGREDR